jgi:hypothetical protein
MTTAWGTYIDLSYVFEVLADMSPYGLNILPPASQIHPGIAVILIIIMYY